MGKVRIFIKKEGRLLRAQNEGVVFFYRVVRKNKRVKFLDYNAAYDLTKYLKYLGSMNIGALGVEDEDGWKEANKGDRF